MKMHSRIHHALGLLLFIIWIIHLILCPYTKVEESFNVQAVHDFLYVGTNLSQYDHYDFPGVVPRTFLGAFITACIAYPIVFLVNFIAGDKFYGLIIARLSLGLLVFTCLNNFRHSIRRTRPSVDFWFILITASQFHFNFYATRFLPNTFALAFVLQVYALLFRAKYKESVWIAVLSASVFRSELILLYFPVFAYLLFIAQSISLRETVINGLLALIISLALTAPFDSALWGRWLWPEGEVWFYNTILNKSSNWGVFPFLWYFYSVIPRLLLTSLPFGLIGLFGASHGLVRRLTLCALAFILLYSILPHKELRFIIYVVPILNLSAAWACDLSWNSKEPWTKFAARLLIVGHLIINALLTCFFLYASYNNYPGGIALSQLNARFEPELALKIHIDAYSAQSGISKFLHQHRNWEYNKSESIVDLNSFDCVLLGGLSENLIVNTFLLPEGSKYSASYPSFGSLNFRFIDSLPFIDFRVSFDRGVIVLCH